MHFLTSNFNLLSKNSFWNNVQEYFFLDKKFNNFFFSLLDTNILNKYETIHVIIFLNKFNFDQVNKSIKSLDKGKIIKSKKVIFFYFYYVSNFNNEKFQIKIFQLMRNLRLQNIKFEINAIENHSKILNEKNRIFLKFPFDINFIKDIKKKLLKNIKNFESKPYKLIILDCDNTLWGGVLDEDDIEGIKYSGDGIGQIFHEFQIKLKELKKSGFILSISSKNTEQKVWQAMKKRGMALQKKDFINPKINWSEKSENIETLINELTLRPTDCIFIDDNIIEIKKVKSSIKNINTIHIDDPINIMKKIQHDPRLIKNKVLEEDIKKYHQYKIKAKYENISKNRDHTISFFKSLKQKVKIYTLDSSNIERASQLFNKTNQFNFNLNRYSILQLNKMKANKNFQVNLFGFEDKFGDHGLIGSYIMKLNKNSSEVIDFVLSCRVLNRYVEDFMVYQILKNRKIKNIYIHYNKTNVNKELIPKFLDKKFFKIVEKKNNRYRYQINLDNSLSNVKKVFN